MFFYIIKLSTYTNLFNLSILKMNTFFAMLIFDFMVCREKYLLENDVLLSALFLDSRFKILLEETQTEKAKIH